ncbi:MAG: hypothetical protein ACI936_003075 [Paraglaciecola sp.]|jgi:hypothetical protein
MKMKFINTVALGLILSVVGFVSTANATLITKTLTSENWDRGDRGSLNDVDLGIFTEIDTRQIISDITFTIELFGDFGRNRKSNREWAKVFLGNESLGKWLDGRLHNDDIDGPNNDRGRGSEIWAKSPANLGSYTINVPDLNALLSGDSLNARFEFSNAVTNNNRRGGPNNRTYTGNIERATVTMSYEVPEPSTLAVLGLGLMSLSLRRFKKQA